MKKQYAYMHMHMNMYCIYLYGDMQSPTEGEITSIFIKYFCTQIPSLSSAQPHETFWRSEETDTK